MRLTNHRTGRNHCIRESFGTRDHVRIHIKFIHSEGRSDATKARNNFVKDKQNAMFRANFTDTFEIAFWWG